MGRAGPDNAELEEKLAQKTAEARILRQVSTQINSTLDLEKIYEIVLGTMDETFGFRHSLILLLDESGETLSVAASRGYQVPVTGAQVKVGMGLVGVVAKRRRMMRASNLGQQRAYSSAIRKEMEQAGRADELVEIPELPGLPNVESQIAIPLMIEDSLIGVFSVESEERKVFSEREEILISIVANQAASAIRNAQLYRAEGERRKELAEAHERLRQLNETLEERVRERTQELWRANRELKAAQAQLIQSAKMAALGDLVAGVAHEINTPLGAIRANADLARRAMAVLAQLLPNDEHARVISGQPSLNSALQALGEAARTTLAGTERISEIVTSMRRFARLDEAERKKADLREGIDSALTLLRHKLRERIEVIRNYGDLPAIVCFPNQLNQVFMNLLVNAIQAMDEGGRITITTGREGDDAVLQFADTGSGIRSEDIERIFDPGFTTRGVGVGMGLGLPISYRIIQEHHGRIEVSSRPGKGSVFTIRLPIAGEQ
jgi:signal transduction histidine kinase